MIPFIFVRIRINVRVDVGFLLYSRHISFCLKITYNIRKGKLFDSDFI